jgi:Patatin-like phospholipase
MINVTDMHWYNLALAVIPSNGEGTTRRDPAVESQHLQDGILAAGTRGGSLFPWREIFSILSQVEQNNKLCVERRPPFECIALLLEGGGALGAYQAGVVEAGIHPNWVAGISIGAIYSALIAGNPPERRVEKMREFWVRVTTDVFGSWTQDFLTPLVKGDWVRGLMSANFNGERILRRRRVPHYSFEVLPDSAALFLLSREPGDGAPIQSHPGSSREAEALELGCELRGGGVYLRLSRRPPRKKTN